MPNIYDLIPEEEKGNITIQQLKDILKETLNPERCLETWYCTNCECMCAGDQTSGMCMGCEELTPEQRGEEG